MTHGGYTPTLLAAELKALRTQYPNDRVWGFYHPGSWSGGQSLNVDDQVWQVQVCRTPLAVSQALAERPADEGLVLLSAVDLQTLPQDVKYRLARRRLHRPNPWDALLSAFKATRVAPTLRSQEWLAEALLAVAPSQGFPPAPAEFIDPDTAWEQLLTRRFGLGDGRPDAVAWLIAGADAAVALKVSSLPPDLRDGLLRRAAATGGPLGEMLARGLVGGAGASLIAAGLLGEVLYVETHQQAPAIIRATALLESQLGVGKVSLSRGRAWFQAARTALGKLAPAAQLAVLATAEAMVAEHDLHAYTIASSQLPAGFQARIAGLGRVLEDYMANRATAPELEASLDQVAEHRMAAAQPERLDRMRMAVRLARYVRSGPRTQASSLAQALRDFQAEGGWVDWARRIIFEGEPQPELSEALQRLLATVRTRRETENRRFAELLAGWNQAPDVTGEVLGIEKVLDEVVSPWAQRQQVLMLVLDGMSMAVYEELVGSMTAMGWGLLRPASERIVLSMVPSVTEFARASLLAGRAVRGNQGSEKQTFAAHLGLRPSSALPAPVLFHKGDLTDGATGQLAPVVREAIGNARIKVVGVVINAVDDHLAKTEQVLATWSVEKIKPLAAILWEAHLAKRVVIVTSDHGHIPEAGLTLLPGGTNERYRTADGPPPGDLERQFQGPRVEAVSGSPAVIAPWSETVRYTAKKNGYHGGVTLAEMTVPLGVFMPLERLASEAESLAEHGWTPAPPREPGWWSPAVVQPVERQETPQEAEPVHNFGPLFAAAKPQPSAAAPADWIAVLLASEAFVAQREHAGPRAPDEDILRRVLALLDANEGIVPKRALASSLGMAEVRLPGLLSALQRILNLDGYPILAVDETLQEIRLDRDLLRRQYQLP